MSNELMVSFKHVEKLAAETVAREMALEDALRGCKAFLQGGEQAPRNPNPEEDDLYLGFYEGDVEAQIEEIDEALKRKEEGL